MIELWQSALAKRMAKPTAFSAYRPLLAYNPTFLPLTHIWGLKSRFK